MEGINLAFFVFKESHDERLGMEEINHVIKVSFKMFEVDGDDCSHVVKLKSFFLISLEAIFFKDVRIDVVDNFGSCNEDVDITFHPEGKGVEFKVNGIFVIVETDIMDMRSLEEHIVPIDLS